MNRRQADDLPEVLKLRIYEVVQAVPVGSVASYGDIATIVGGGCDARMVGYALNAIPKAGAEQVPWQRIVNAQGGISTKWLLQRKLLEDEGVQFDAEGRIPLARYRWPGPSEAWACEHGYGVLPPRPDDP